MKNVLVTGGCGFLGGAIVRQLVESDRDVHVQVLALPGETTRNIDGLEGVEVIRGNVLSVDDCRSVVRGMDTVFHAAAIYDAHAPDPRLMYEVNNRGTYNMLEACRRAKVKRVIYTASIVALGRPEKGGIANESTPYEAWNVDFAYSRSKYHSREIALCFAEWGLDVRVVCPGLIFGPGDVAPTPSGKLILESMKGGPPIYMEGGASYVDVRDCADVHIRAAEQGKKGETYIATGHNMSNEVFMKTVDGCLGNQRRFFKLPVAAARAAVTAMNVWADKQGSEPRLPQNFFEYSLKSCFFDNAKSRQELGASYRPIETTISDAIAYFKNNGASA